MPAIGFRNRLFLTILLVLGLVTTASLVLHSQFLRRERLALIDQQVRETAASLLDSQLAQPRVNFREAEAIISEELGDSRIGKFFIIRNDKGETVFSSNTVNVLPVARIPSDQTWITVRTNGKYIRALNLKLPRIPDRSLQVGLVLDEDLASPGYWSWSSLIFFTVIFVMGLAATWFSTSFLLRPVSRLEVFLTGIAQQSRRKFPLPLIPEELAQNPRSDAIDEFERMLAALNALIRQLNKNYQFSRLWAYQMAHELKTPLAILGFETEKLHAQGKTDTRPLEAESARISGIINSFLNWAELENSPQPSKLFINPLAKVASSVAARITGLGSSRIQVDIPEDVQIAADPQHLEQLLANLLKNAVRYSTPGAPVQVSGDRTHLLIADHGPGIPADVLNRLGEPFNRGHTSGPGREGHGLGLAWVNSICQQYGWELKIRNRPDGADVRVEFPPVEALLE